MNVLKCILVQKVVFLILIRTLARLQNENVGANLNIFKYFIIILIVSTNYIFVHLLDNKVFYCT